MAKSIKSHMGYYYGQVVGLVGGGLYPKAGKVKTSRWLRRKAKRELQRIISGEKEYFEFYHHQDKNRGNKGSKEWGWGWKYFGDGYHHVWTEKDLSAYISLEDYLDDEDILWHMRRVFK